MCIAFCGCANPGAEGNGYCSRTLFPEDVSTVYVEMFDNASFHRGVEYEVTDALAKRIEAHTPYKIISSRDRADTIISGKIVSVGFSALSAERETGRSLENQLQVRAVVNWKNLKTGQLFIDNRTVTASASFSQWQNQGFGYASAIAANNLAEKIVESMEKQW
ncbi:MAG TPA: LptE family protein [Sedimentisphaerales bacterium]|nr:LptE family protein [Sedimentisphaerales bacterium]